MKRENFNEGWKVWKDNNPFELVFHVPEEAVCVTLPYDAMFAEEQREDSVNRGSNGFLDGGEYKYYKRFFVPEEDRGSRLMLQFEGVYRQASVFINQSLVGQCAFGYTDFFVEIQDYIKYGQENEVLVVVKCGTKNSRWYSGAGIYRDVFLYRSREISIEPYSLRLTTLEADAEGALVSVSAKLCNGGMCPRELAAELQIQAADGSIVVEHTYPVRLLSHGAVELRKTVYLPEAKLWSEDTPELYTVSLKLSDEKGSVDWDQITTGIRKLSLDSRHGLRVNGKEVKLRGACLHHDQFLLGAATYDEYEYRRIRRLKEAGFNAVRSAHNHASGALLRACDRLGVYVMDELVDVWNKSKTNYDYSLDFSRSWERDVEAMVAADYNHPSVIFYSTGNEIFEICTEKGIETSRMLGDKFHQLDPTRFTTNGINGAFAAGDGLAEIVSDLTDGKADVSGGDVNVFMGMMETNMPGIVSHRVIGDILERLETTMDVLGYNYMTARYLPDAAAYPDRLMVGSETYPKQIAENWDAILQCPAALGDFTWTGWDYLGEAAPVYPALLSEAGDLTAIGVRRPVSYYREIVFGRNKGPCIAVQHPKDYGRPRQFGPWIYTDCKFCYTYEGWETKPILIQVYGGGDSVELFLNGKSLGVQPCGKETAFETKFLTEYEPGELVAVAYEQGKEVGRSVLKTAGKPEQFQIEVEQDGAEAELIFVNLELQDKDGTRIFSEQPVSIEVRGGAVLEAFGSEHAKHQRGFGQVETTLSDGCALAILRRTESGEIRVKVSGEGIEKELVL